MKRSYFDGVYFGGVRLQQVERRVDVGLGRAVDAAVHRDDAERRRRVGWAQVELEQAHEHLQQRIQKQIVKAQVVANYVTSLYVHVNLWTLL